MRTDPTDVSFDGEFDLDSVLIADADHAQIKGRGSITESIIERTNLSETQFAPITVSETRLVSADLANASWQGVTARGVTFTRCRAIGLRLAIDHALDLCFEDCVLDYASIHIERVKRGLVFKGCSFREATISGALAETTFLDCDLSNAEFTVTSAFGCDLRGSQLATTRGLTRLRGAKVSIDQVVSFSGQLAAETGFDIADLD